MKRYLVYYDKSPIGGLDAFDYVEALNKARQITPTNNKSHIRVRLANKEGTLLWALARQSDYR